MAARSYPLFHVDAFTRTLFSGNPAAVVLEAEGLTDEEMQRIARELGSCDTAFVLAADAPDHDLRVRFFTARCEVPFVGHATIAVHVVRATRAALSRQPLRQRSGSGIVEVDVREHSGGLEVGIRQNAAQLVRAFASPELDALLDAVGASHGDLDPHCPPEIYLKGSTRLLVGLRSSGALLQLRPNFEALSRLTPHAGAEGFFLFVLSEAAGNVATEARLFCPAIGVPEDAVSGNAHAMLGAYLVRHRLLDVKSGSARFRGLQGRSLGRPGEVRVEVAANEGEPHSVRIAGNAVIAYETSLRLPPAS